MELVSVIVPVYNVENYISKCIQSIINQSYKNLEIILIDDGSTDNSNLICRNFSKKDKRVKIFCTNNYGLSHARNFGIAHSHGDYIIFIDSDDYINKDMINTLMNKSDNADLVICNYQRISNTKEVVQSKKNKKNEIWNFKQFWYEYYYGGLSEFCGVAWNKLYKKKLFENIRYPFGKIHEDEYVICPITSYCNEIKVINDSLYYYVQRTNSIVDNIVQGNIEGSFDNAEAFLNRCSYFSSINMLNIEKANLLSIPFHLVMGLSEGKGSIDSKRRYVLLRESYFNFVKEYLKSKFSLKLSIKSLMLLVPNIYLFFLKKKNK